MTSTDHPEVGGLERGLGHQSPECRKTCERGVK